jgi:N-acetylmuramoyl-L-alanine amidase
MSRSIVLTGSRIAALVLAALSTFPAMRALADPPLTVTYQGQTIRFSHVSSANGEAAVGVNDPGFAALLRSTGALITWKPGERYVLITTSAPTVVSFAIGDRRYDVGPISLQAKIAPYERGSEAYLPLIELLRSLDLALEQDGGAKVLQPQLTTLDVRTHSDGVSLAAHGGAPLHPRVVRQSASEVAYAFDGVGTALTGVRQVNAGGVRSVAIQTTGTIRQPTTTVTIELEPGATVAPPQSTGDRDAMLSIGAGATPLQTVAQESPTPEPALPVDSDSANASGNAPASVTGVSAQPSDSGLTVTIAVNGSAAFEWHRLRDPDNRFWVDIENAQLGGPPIDENLATPVIALRARQVDASTVRVALSLDGPKSISITPSATGLILEIGSDEVSDAPRSGTGSIGSVLSSSEQNAAPVTPAPSENSFAGVGTPDQSAWKFGPRSQYVPTNPHLIVIDPGHGGSDTGTEHGGLKEADLTLDMARRLRDILIARGWQVQLTRTTDVDVYQPNDSPHDELQARVDVANNAGARLFVSVHVNAFINSGPSGTTYYVSKPDDTALARIVETHLSADGTKDDGVVKSHMYVTYHTRMPAVLIETAFLTNPGDYALLASAAWRQKVAQEIADGIGEYAREYPVPSAVQ